METDLELEDGDDLPPSRTYDLVHPIDFGKERIETLELKPTGRAMRDFSLEITKDGGMRVELYRLCLVGLTMAGKPSAIADKMDAEDVSGLGMRALAFIMPGQATGKIALQ